jgi:hypothetical protein
MRRDEWRTISADIRLQSVHGIRREMVTFGSDQRDAAWFQYTVNFVYKIFDIGYMLNHMPGIDDVGRSIRKLMLFKSCL